MIGHPNLKLWVPMDNGLTDCSGGNLSLSLAGSTLPTANSGVMGGSYNFTGATTGSRISGSDANLKFDTYTYLAWVYPTNTGSVRSVAISVGGYTYFQDLSIAPDRKIRGRSYTTVDKLAVTTGSIPLNAWSLIYSVRDYTNQLMKAGFITTGGVSEEASVALGAGNAGLASGTYDSLCIGNEPNGANNYGMIGKIDNAQIYNVALSLSDIKRIMHGKHPLARS